MELGSVPTIRGVKSRLHRRLLICLPFVTLSLFLAGGVGFDTFNHAEGTLLLRVATVPSCSTETLDSQGMPKPKSHGSERILNNCIVS